MSQQPEKAKPTGLAALQAAEAKRATRRPAPSVQRDRPTPPPPPPAPAPAPKEPVKAPEITQERPNQAPEGEGSRASVTVLRQPQEPPGTETPVEPVVPVEPQQPQPPVDTTPEPVAAPPVGVAPVSHAPVTEQAPPTPTPTPEQPSLAALLRKRPASPLTAVQQQMYLGAVGKNFKSIANIIRMLSERADESSALIEEATSKGLPEAEIERLAITHGIHDWLPFILAVEGEQPQ